MRRVVAATLLALVFSVTAATAVGQTATKVDLSAAEFRALADRAITDPAVRSRLLEVRTVDGREVDTAAALADASGADLEARLRVLAGDPGGKGVVPATEARDDARRVLRGGAFKKSHVPRPLHGVLQWIGERLAPLTGPVVAAWQWIVARLWAKVMFVIVVLGAAAFAAGVLGRRRTAAGVTRARRRRAEGSEDPDELEALAERDEREGNYAAAVRLRFRAGLLRLDAAGALRYRPSLTTGAVTRSVPVPALTGLARTFDEIAYGGRQAGAGDVDAARRQWPVVLAEAPSSSGHT